MSYTDQDIYNTVCSHAVTQGEKAMSGSVDLGTSNCKYRGSKGTSCFIGCLIADEHYSTELEGLCLESLVTGALCDSGVISLESFLRDSPTITLLERLQDIHDDCEVWDWPKQLTTLANDLGLQPFTEWGELALTSV